MIACILSKQPTASAHSAAPLVGYPRDEWEGPSRIANEIDCVNAYILERDLSRAQTILCRIAAARNTRRTGIHHEEADSSLLPGLSGRSN
ncbi:hypothetical protein AYJ54_42965 [Bradyrhizobium centrolobii]|uniref:Uncharacterized protein n=1 Tax=Bradyrhizobium centrolobii TaxID=1505087 RepID=A0A176Z3J8_9BRAD|nr:hypothetical protein AYJ54_42965 [Bradyrhizobium centrolobii]